MLEPGASFVSAVGGGRPGPGLAPDLVVSIGASGGTALSAISGFPSAPSFGLSCAGSDGVSATVEVLDNAGSVISAYSWWSDLAAFAAELPLESVRYSQDGAYTLLPHVVRLYGAGSAASVSLSLPDDALFDLEANVLVQMGPLSAARGVRTVAFASADAKFALRDGMFKGCSRLKSVGGAKWMDLPEEAFRGCVSLEECPLGYVQNNVDGQTLGEMCLYGCKKMPGNDGTGTLRLSFAARAYAGCLAGCERITLVSHSGAILSGRNSPYFGNFSNLGLERACPEDPTTAGWPSAGTRETQLYVEDGAHAAHVWKSVGGTWGWT